MSERNIGLLLQYDGTAYVGWQRQPAQHGLSVQQVLEDTLSLVFREEIKITGAGRTDSGVHAAGQCCNFMANKPVPAEKLADILNMKLPPDIHIRKAWEAEPDFHARYSAKGKRYRYLLQQGGKANAFNYRYSWRVPGELDVEAMEEAASLLLGTHNFRNFTLSAVSAKNFERTIYRISLDKPTPGSSFPWEEMDSPLAIEVEGNGFLYKMVRIIVSRLVAVGQGLISLKDMQGYLDGSFDLNIPPAPAGGLMMMEVYY